MNEQKTDDRKLSALQFFDIMTHAKPFEQKEVLEKRADTISSYLKTKYNRMTKDTLKSIVSETLMRFMERYYPLFLANELEELREIQTIDGKLCRFAENIAKENIRQVDNSNRFEEKEDSIYAQANKLGSYDLMESDFLEKNITLPEIAAQLIKAIHQLPESHQNVFIRRLFGEKPKDIANALNITETKERKDAERAKKALASILPTIPNAYYEDLVQYIAPFFQHLFKNQTP